MGISHMKQKANDDGHQILKHNSRRKIETSLWTPEKIKIGKEKKCKMRETFNHRNKIIYWLK